MALNAPGNCFALTMTHCYVLKFSWSFWRLQSIFNFCWFLTLFSFPFYYVSKPCLATTMFFKEVKRKKRWACAILWQKIVILLFCIVLVAILNQYDLQKAVLENKYLQSQPVIYGESGNETISINKDSFILHHLFCFSYRSSNENKCLTATFIFVTGMELPRQLINFVLFALTITVLLSYNF